MKLNYGKWLYGLVGDMIRGGSSAVVAGFTVSVMDPKDYNFGNAKFYSLMLAVFTVHAIFSLMTYLQKNALPEIITTTTVEERGPHSTITTTGTGDGIVTEERSEHQTTVTKKVEEVKPDK